MIVNIDNLKRFYDSNPFKDIAKFEWLRKLIIPFNLIFNLCFCLIFLFIISSAFNGFIDSTNMPLTIRIIISIFITLSFFVPISYYIIKYLKEKYHVFINHKLVYYFFIILLTGFILIIARLLDFTSLIFHLNKGELEKEVLKIPIAVGIIFFLVILKIIGVSLLRKYKIKFKNIVIKPLINLIDPNFIYYPDRFIPENDFQKSMFFQNSRISYYNGGDYVKGNIDKTEFEYSQLEVRELINKSNYQIFKGIFYQLEFNKNFQGTTFVLPDIAEKYFGHFGKKLQEINPNYPLLVNLENPIFEKYFAVYSTDQVEARYILSLSFMERLVALREKFGRKLLLAFVNSKMYLAIPFEKDIFAPKTFEKYIPFEKIEEYYSYLSLLSNIITDLKLNIRIWG